MVGYSIQNIEESKSKSNVILRWNATNCLWSCLFTRFYKIFSRDLVLKHFKMFERFFLEALKLIQMKTSFKYDFYLKLSLVTDIGLNSDTVDHSPHFYLVYKQSSVTEFEWPGIAEIAPSFCQTYLVFFFRFLLSLLTYI